MSINVLTFMNNEVILSVEKEDTTDKKNGSMMTTGKIFRYAHVSTKELDEGRQIEELEKCPLV